MQSFYHTLSSKREIRTSDEMSDSYGTTASSETSSDLRVGAFNVRVFGQKKVADENVLNILVKVSKCSV